MNQENDRTKSRKLSDVAFYAIGAGVLLLISIPLTWGLLLEEKPPDWTAVDTGLAVAFLCLCWSLAASVLASCFRQPRMQKFGGGCYTFAVYLLIAYLIFIWLWPVIDRGETISTRAMVFGSVLLLTVIIGLLFFLSGKGQAGTPANKADDSWASPLMLVAWPFGLFLVSPVGGLLYLIIAGGIAYLGEWIGEKFSHPLLGAIGLPVGLLMVLLGLVIRSARRKIK